MRIACRRKMVCIVSIQRAFRFEGTERERRSVNRCYFPDEAAELQLVLDTLDKPCRSRSRSRSGSQRPARHSDNADLSSDT